MIRECLAKIEIVFKDDDVLRLCLRGLLQDREVTQKAPAGTDRREASGFLRAHGRKKLCAPANSRQLLLHQEAAVGAVLQVDNENISAVNHNTGTLATQNTTIYASRLGRVRTGVLRNGVKSVLVSWERSAPKRPLPFDKSATLNKEPKIDQIMILRPK